MNCLVADFKNNENGLDYKCVHCKKGYIMNFIGECEKINLLNCQENEGKVSKISEFFNL